MQIRLSEEAQSIVDDFNYASDDEIIEFWFSDYWDNRKPWVKEALTALRIADHEVISWGYCNLK